VILASVPVRLQVVCRLTFGDDTGFKQSPAPNGSRYGTPNIDFLGAVHWQLAHDCIKHYEDSVSPLLPNPYPHLVYVRLNAGIFLMSDERR